MNRDSQLQQDVMDELKWPSSVHSEHIGVEVNDGVVTLTGHVGSYREKINAQLGAQRISGVRALAVDLDVKISSMGKRDDTDSAASVQTARGWLPTGYL